ncbi:aminopeptidase [Clostridium sp. BJN0001]|uniref:aminopeptidase n=1 Tax=Clostridium sp. BJN0001 TaxID=2930219 RepID=UPI001FD54089|nr:aminopeptidase [Clostridium sp. BJN0001]
MIKDLLIKYAELIIVKGINLKKDGLVVISSPIECSEFASIIAKKAFKHGASDVKIKYSDSIFNKIRLENISYDTLSIKHNFEKDEYEYYVDNNASFISISAEDPDIYKDVDSKKLSLYNKARRQNLKKYFDACNSNKNAWTIISIPTKSWAHKIFNTLPEDKALEKLYDAIFNIMRIYDDDPIKSWTKHINSLKEKVSKLNSLSLKSLHYKNSLGTDLTVELADDSIWCGGDDITLDSTHFIANMPTEEVYTTPKRDHVNGVCVSSKPLSYLGNLIENFSITFKDGKAVSCTAEKGLDVLKEIISSDENACYLGEAALVPFSSPISKSNIIFYKTLYDENASCHLAFGSSYPCCIKNGDNLSSKELLKKGANTSMTHVDFMIGTSDLSIDGIRKDNKTISIFKNGEWNI